MARLLGWSAPLPAPGFAPFPVSFPVPFTVPFPVFFAPRREGAYKSASEMGSRNLATTRPGQVRVRVKVRVRVVC